MATRWIIRLVAIISVLLLGAFADAQTQQGAAPAPANSGGGAVRSGGSAPVHPPTAASGGSKSTSGSGTGSGSTSGGSSGSNQPKPPTPPPAKSTPTGTGSVITGTGTPITGTGAPITQTPPTGNLNPIPPKDIPENHHRHHRDPNDPNRFHNAPVYILPQTYGWAPYTWWFNGNSYWMPPIWDDGYDGNNNDGYVGRDDDRYDRVAPTTPSVPATPSPAQIQAQSTNALQGMPAYSQAMVEFNAAQQAYQNASARVLAKLRKEPEYQRLVADRDRAEDHVEAVQAGANIPPNPERVTPAAQHKLNVSSKITKMEQDAIAADPEASAAKARMVEANARLSALRKQAEASGGRAQ